MREMEQKRSGTLTKIAIIATAGIAVGAAIAILFLPGKNHLCKFPEGIAESD